MNLNDRSNINVAVGDGRDWPRQPTDVVYVNFATLRPADAWIENLAPGGRLILPLGVPREAPNGGAWRGLNALALLVTRRSEGFEVRALGQVSFVFGEGHASSDEELCTLGSSLQNGGWERIRSLVWKEPAERRNAGSKATAGR